MGKTIVLSDCHLGSPESNYRDLNRFLARLECDRLILLGDAWDLWDMSTDDIRKNFSDTIMLLRKLLDDGTKICLILGNHDDDYFEDPIMPLSEIPVKRHADILLPSGKKLALIHGHEFDPLVKDSYGLSRFLAWVNKTARGVFGLSWKSFKRKDCVDLSGKSYSDTVREIHKKARDAYSKYGYDALIMGHTHCPTVDRAMDPIEFYNSGDWKWSNTYIEILGDDIRVKRFQ